MVGTGKDCMTSKFWIGGGQRVWFDDEYLDVHGIFTLNFLVENKEGYWINKFGDKEVCCDVSLSDVKNMIEYLKKIEKRLETKS